jgi:hypothetical protein
MVGAVPHTFAITITGRLRDVTEHAALETLGSTSRGIPVAGRISCARGGSEVVDAKFRASAGDGVPFAHCLTSTGGSVGVERASLFALSGTGVVHAIAISIAN